MSPWFKDLPCPPYLKRNILAVFDFTVFLALLSKINFVLAVYSFWPPLERKFLNSGDLSVLLMVKHPGQDQCSPIAMDHKPHTQPKVFFVAILKSNE